MVLSARALTRVRGACGFTKALGVVMVVESIVSSCAVASPATVCAYEDLEIASRRGFYGFSEERKRARAPHRSSRDRPRALAMGKRKSSKPPPKKVAPKVDTTFTCPFCNHDKSVFARLDHVAEKGLVECGTCGQKYTCNITHLSEPIDVYSDWIDACERINAKDEEESEEED